MEAGPPVNAGNETLCQDNRQLHLTAAWCGTVIKFSRMWAFYYLVALISLPKNDQERFQNCTVRGLRCFHGWTLSRALPSHSHSWCGRWAGSMRPAHVKVNNPVALSGAVLRKLVFKEQAVIFSSSFRLGSPNQDGSWSGVWEGLTFWFCGCWASCGREQRGSNS